MVVLMTVVAILFAPMPLSALNADFAAVHLVELTDHDHDRVEVQGGGGHHAKGGADHRHGHNPTDHTHDIPNGVHPGYALTSRMKSSWTLAAAASPVGGVADTIERPPRIRPLA